MRIERGPDPGPFNNSSDYKRKYRPFLRSLFRCQCAYCQSHDDHFGGEEGATVDHFKPESRYHELRCSWSNIYYACQVCNCHYKKQFPTPDEEAKGKRFVDPCAEDPDDHFRMVKDESTGDISHIRPLSPAAEYTIFRLKLNDRPSLRDYWRALHCDERKLAERLVAIESSLDSCADLATKLNDPAIASLRSDFESQKQNCVQQLERIQSLRPFPIDNS